MGYTHYWEMSQPASEETFNTILEKSAKIIKHFSHLVEDDSTSTEIDFNGRREQTHEDFYLPNSTEWACCKTARKLYDVVVVCTLIMIKKEIRYSIKVSSDGDTADWEDGKRAYNEIFKENINLSIKDGELIFT